MDAHSVQTQSTATLVEALRARRTEQRRDAAAVLIAGRELERRHKLAGGSDDLWDAVEQVAVAAVEAGDVAFARTLAARLTSHFRESTPHRVHYLQGLVLEAENDLAGARARYEANIREDETDVPSRKRLVALHLSSPLVALPEPAPAGTSSKALPSVAAPLQPYLAASLCQEKGIQILVHYLDTYYADLAGWLALSTAYADLGLYAQALAALAHAVVLAPGDAWVALKHAETAYTAGDVQLAWKGFLRVVEMSTEEGDERPLKGAARRAAMGAKLCIPRLRALRPAKDGDPLLVATKVDEVEVVLTRLLVEAYQQTPGAVGAGVVSGWLGGEAAAR
ncbi:hypothetical protein JCM3770_003822 [Rhodotorula araucariae]